MSEIGKLRHLLEHWEEHNSEHAKTYREWARKTASEGRDDIAALLAKLAERTEDLNGLIKKTRAKAG